MRVFIIFTILCVTMLSACSSMKETSGGDPPKRSRHSRDLIVAEEIKTSSANNAYDLIRSLRPYWLRGRGLRSILDEAASYPVVYLDNTKYGDVDSLSTISTNNISVIKFLNASDATTRYGMNHTGGAIIITLTR